MPRGCLLHQDKPTPKNSTVELKNVSIGQPHPVVDGSSLEKDTPMADRLKLLNITNKEKDTVSK